MQVLCQDQNEKTPNLIPKSLTNGLRGGPDNFFLSFEYAPSM